MCDAVWIIEPWYHIDGIMRCIKYDEKHNHHWNAVIQKLQYTS